MGRVTIKTDENGCGSIRVEVPFTELERVLPVRRDGESPHVQLGVEQVGGGLASVIHASGADLDSEVVVDFVGEPVSSSPAAAVDEVAASAEVPGDGSGGMEPPESVEDLVKNYSREDLDARAEAAGVDNPSGLGNKQEVAEATLEAESGTEETGDGDGNPDSD